MNKQIIAIVSIFIIVCSIGGVFATNDHNDNKDKKDCKDCKCEPTQAQVDIAVAKYLNNNWNKLITDVSNKVICYINKNINLFKGPKGDKGDTGDVGAAGTNGTDGIGLNGTDGKDGQDGIGINGTNGTNGSTTINNFYKNITKTITGEPTKDTAVDMETTGAPLLPLGIVLVCISGAIGAIVYKR